MRSEVYRNTIPQKFSDPATLKMVNADLDMFQAYHDIITKLEFQIEDSKVVRQNTCRTTLSGTILRTTRTSLLLRSTEFCWNSL